MAIEANPRTFKSITRTKGENLKKINYGSGKSDGSLDFYAPIDANSARNSTFLDKEGDKYFKLIVQFKNLMHARRD